MINIKKILCRSLDVFAKQKRGMTDCIGRSMVEMLGVLAIIGVLSAGALAGYSKAMFRHRVNQTIDIFHGVLQRFAELEEKDLTDVWFDYWDTESMVKYGFLKECQQIDVDGEPGCKLPIGSLQIGIKDDEGVRGKIFMNFSSAKECIAFTSVGWENVVPVDWWKPSAEMGIEGLGGFYYTNNPSPKMSDIIEACETNCAENYCYFSVIVHQSW